MKYGLAGLTLASGLFLMTPAVADEGSALDAVVESVEKKYTDVSALEAHFVQTTRSEVFGDESQAGELALKRPAKMRWAFEGDTKQFVTDGETMWVYTQADNQVIKYADIAGQRSAMDQLLTSLDSLDEMFDVELVAPAEGASSTTLKLTPKEADQVKSVRLVLDGDLLVQQIVITDPFDSVTELQFSGVKLNGEIPDSRFEFTVPEGAELIDAGGF